MAANKNSKTKRTVNRESVLLKKTPAELRDLIGADTPIGVSRRELRAIVLKQKSAEMLGDAGL